MYYVLYTITLTSLLTTTGIYIGARAVCGRRPAVPASPAAAGVQPSYPTDTYECYYTHPALSTVSIPCV